MIHNWQKGKSTFFTCPCHNVLRVKAVGLKSSNHTLKKYDFCENLGQFCENVIGPIL